MAHLRHSGLAHRLDGAFIAAFIAENRIILSWKKSFSAFLQAAYALNPSMYAACKPILTK